MNDQALKSKLDIGLEEKSYKFDLEVTDRFQALSTEIARIVLLGIAVLGFLLSKDSKLELDFHLASIPILCGMTLLAVAIATSLAHRYFSNDCLVKYRPDVERSNRDGANKHRLDLIRNMRICWCLRPASVSLALGVLSIATTFWIAVSNTN